MNTAANTAAHRLLADADQCVKCGLCLPHCPTYALSRHEADSPRGRIALAQGLASGLIAATPRVTAHLDGCLSCRACEAACPAKVPYGRVLDATRAALATPSRTRLPRLLGAVLASPATRGLLRAGLHLLGLPSPLWMALAQRRGALARWASLIPRPARLRQVVAAPRGGVAIFTGCMGDVLEREVAADLADLLRALGETPALPPAQTCCGALHQHGGLPGTAQARAARNAAAFADSRVVLPLASGCGAGLWDNGDAALRARLRDPCDWLAERLATHPLPLAVLPLRVAVHRACTQAHVLRAGSAIERLLAHIPGVVVHPLAPDSGCCGAAGTHFLSHPAAADALLAPKLAAAAALHPDAIVSANIGCSLHLAAGLRRQGQRVELLHPISVLARAWRAAGPTGPLPAAAAAARPSRPE